MADTIEYTPRSRSHVYVSIFIGLLAVLAIGYEKQTEVRLHSQVAARIDVLERKTKELDQQIMALHSTPAPTSAKPAPPLTVAPPATPPSADADARIKALEEKLGTLVSQQNSMTQNLLESGNVKGSVAELANRFKSLEATQQSAEARTQHLITRLGSFYRLNDAVRAGRPYTNELAQMEELAADQAAIRSQLEKLEPFADTGIPASWQLKQEFSDAVRVALAPKTGANAKFSDRLMANIKRFVTVRRIGAPDDEAGPKAAIARAEAHMERQEIEAALAEVSDLEQPYSSAFTDWVIMTNFYITVPEVLLAVQDQIIEDIYITANLPASPAASKP